MFDYIMPIVAVIFICLVAYLLVRESQSLFGSRQRPEASTGYKPTIRPKATKTSPDTLLTFKGQGAQRTDSFFLECAIFRIEYQFPADAKVKVELVSVDGSNRKLLANKAGFDSSTFNVQIARYYLLDVKPEAQDTEWAVIIKPF